MKTLLSVFLVAICVTASAVAQSPGTGNVVLQIQPTIYTPTISNPTFSGTMAVGNLTLTGTLTGGVFVAPSISGTTAPSASGTGTITSGTATAPYYGTGTGVLTTSGTWLVIKSGTGTYRIPAY